MTSVRVLDVMDLSPTVYLLRVERGGLSFEPGQYVRLGPDPLRMREYTVYSTPGDRYLDALIKIVPGGAVAGRLRRLHPGEPVCLDGPFGGFVIPDQSRGGRFLFVATGTGIAPFHCFELSYPGLDHRLLHGVRTASELYHRECYPAGRHVPCLSRDAASGFHGRVTDWLRAHPAEPGVHAYLCGGYPMISDCYGILREQGLPPEDIRSEVYF